jgi:hypothetical protein
MPCIVIALIIAGAYLVIMIFRASVIKASPPPGWIDAPEIITDPVRESLKDKYSNSELDYMFYLPESASMGVSDDAEYAGSIHAAT